MPTADTLKVALGAFAEKFRSNAQGIDEIDRDNPAILTAIKYVGGELTLKPIILKTREPVYVQKPDGATTLEGKDSEVVAIDGHGVPIYDVHLNCATARENKEGVEAAKAVELATIDSHSKTQNYHILASIILGVWGAIVIYGIFALFAGIF